MAIILSVFLYYLLTNDALHKISLVAGGLMMGGGVGNLIDRIFNDGAVVDFLNIGIGSVRTGIFNVADMSIMLGLVLFLLAAKNDAAIKNKSLPTDDRGNQNEEG